MLKFLKFAKELQVHEESALTIAHRSIIHANVNSVESYKAIPWICECMHDVMFLF